MELILPLLILVAFWFLVVRPVRKRQADLQATQDATTVGTRVMLSSGFFGSVVEDRAETFMVELAPETVVEVAKGAVVRIVEPVVLDAADGTIDASETSSHVAFDEGDRPHDRER